MDNNVISITKNSILRGATKAYKDKNEPLGDELRNIYFKVLADVIIFPKDLPLVKYLESLDAEQKHVNITADTLLHSLGIAKASYNYKMEKKLGSYYRAYIDNIRADKSDIKVVSKILSDKEVINFINKNNNIRIVDAKQNNSNINIETILYAFGIAKANYNYEMEKSLGSYYIAYIDCIRNGRDTIELISQISSDTGVAAFIDKNNSLEEFIKKLQNNKEKKKVKKLIGLPEVA